MTGRDRMVVLGLVVVALLGAAWLLVVSPERKKAGEVSTQVTSAQSQLSTAEGALASARTAEAQYATAYSAVVSLGKAVPADEEVPSLIYQLAQASHQKNVEFASIVSGGGSGASSSAASAAAPGATPTAFTAMPFTFVFNGTFFSLEHLFEQLNRFTVRSASGALKVSGRLLTVQSVHLAPQASEEKGKGAAKLTGTITASAYVLPSSQGLTAGATASSPAAGSTSTSSGSTSTATPAIVRVTP